MLASRSLPFVALLLWAPAYAQVPAAKPSSGTPAAKPKASIPAKVTKPSSAPTPAAKPTSGPEPAKPSTAILLTPPKVAITAKDPSGSCRLAPPSETARYNQVFRSACHNCYEKKHAARFTDALDRTRVVEIDFYDHKDAVSGGRAGAWFVRHDPGTLARSGNDNNCTGDGKGTNDLAACLRDIKRWSDAHRGHEVITVVLDKKQGWGNGRRPHDLDALIASIFPRHQLYTPSDLRGTRSSLRAAARGGGWATEAALRGKIVFVLTGGQFKNHNKTQHDYVVARGAAARIFVAPDADEPSDVTGTPNQFSTSSREWVVFYNIKSGNESVASLVQANGYVSRVWGADKDKKSTCTIARSCVNFNAVDDFSAPGARCDNMSRAVLIPRTVSRHHHHKRGSNCEHGKWATDDREGHHHHKRGSNCEHGLWATDDQAGHHHHLRGSNCDHGHWATDDRP